MQIQVEVISVGSPQTIPTKNGKSYQAIEIAYKKDGKIEGKKIMSFTNPSVFKAVQTLAQGDVVSVTTEKNDAGYWQWEGVEKDVAVTTVTNPAGTSGSGTSKTYTSNYETKEERAAKQVMIVRQSSISSAVNLLGSKAKAADVINTAKEFEAYVMGVSASACTVAGFEDFENDIPL